VLVEEHRVDALERDLDARLRQHPAAGDDAIAGQHEVGVAPPEPLDPEVDSGDHQHHEGTDGQRLLGITPDQEDGEAEGDGHHQAEHGEGEGQPVGPEVEDELLAVVEQLAGEGHGDNLSPGPVGVRGARPGRGDRRPRCQP
jgi:hypothetical protein